MTDIADWRDVQVIVHIEDGIMECSEPAPKNKVACGYYNFMSRTGFHGHLKHERCAAIAFVERLFMSRTSNLMIFINSEGGIMCNVFIGRDEKDQLIEN